MPDQRSGQLALSPNAVCVKFLNLHTEYLYSIQSDDLIFEASKKYSPVIVHSPGATASQNFKRLAKEISSLEINGINETFNSLLSDWYPLEAKSWFDMADLDLYAQVQKQGQDPILKHVGLVKRTALHLKARIPQVMDVDELIQVGMVGLIEASQNFDVSVVWNLKFSLEHELRERSSMKFDGSQYCQGLRSPTFATQTRQPKN